MRISTFSVRVPSVEERKDDIPTIIESLLPKACRDAHVGVTMEDLPKGFISAISKTPPKGNIRGLEQALSQLLTFCPRNHLGRPNLERWKAIEELRYLHVAAPGPAAAAEPLTLDDFLKRPFDVVSTDFPGITEFIEVLRQKIVADAVAKHPKQTRAAKALRMSEGNLSRLLAVIEAARRPARTNQIGGNA